jgi:nitrate/nitrite transport system permease protein
MKKNISLSRLFRNADVLVLPLVGVLGCLLLWQLISGSEVRVVSTDDFGDPVTTVRRLGISADLPSPLETWRASSRYLVEPFAKRGELDQGILAFTWLSLKLVVQGYVLALLLGTPVGFLLGGSEKFRKAFDPIIQVLRPVSPLAWLPLGMVLFLGAKKAEECIPLCAPPTRPRGTPRRCMYRVGIPAVSTRSTP